MGERGWQNKHEVLNDHGGNDVSPRPLPNNIDSFRYEPIKLYITTKSKVTEGTLCSRLCMKLQNMFKEIINKLWTLKMFIIIPQKSPT